jgi:hypothetical protein
MLYTHATIITVDPSMSRSWMGNGELGNSGWLDGACAASLAGGVATSGIVMKIDREIFMIALMI